MKATSIRPANADASRGNREVWIAAEFVFFVYKI